MTKIDTSGWGEFRIGDMFDVSYGKFIAKKEADENANIPHITASGVNNGISYNVSEAMFPANCLTVASDGAIGATYYQDTPFSASNIVSVLVPHTGIDLSKYVALFICTAIKAASRKYSWGGFKFSVDRVRNTTILLPQTPDHTPDFDYMEDYMKEITKLATKRVEKLKKEKPQTKIDTSNWKKFKVGELFETVNNNGKQVPTGANVPSQELKSGTVPRISVTGVNNGVVGYYDSTHKNYKVYNNFISVNFLGNAFYQENNASLDMKVHCLKLKNKELNKYLALFLVTIINKLTTSYSYANQLSSTSITQLQLPLPITSEGTPDFDYMENYMKNLTEKAKKKFSDIPQ